MDSDKSSSSGSWLGGSLAVILAIYVGFPALWIWPIWKLHSNQLPEWIAIPIIPLDWLCDWSPEYKYWAQWGVELLEIRIL